jgi:hypothetical protein
MQSPAPSTFHGKKWKDESNILRPFTGELAGKSKILLTKND